jgi:L-serine deaminase
MTTPTEPESEPASAAKHVRSFLRAFVATNYLLGKRHAALSAGVRFTDPAAQRALTEITDQLSHGQQQQRARILAAEVGRLMRSLGSQRLK